MAKACAFNTGLPTQECVSRLSGWLHMTLIVLTGLENLKSNEKVLNVKF